MLAARAAIAADYARALRRARRRRAGRRATRTTCSCRLADRGDASGAAGSSTSSALPKAVDRDGVIAALDRRRHRRPALPALHPPLRLLPRALRLPRGRVPGRRGLLAPGRWRCRSIPALPEESASSGSCDSRCAAHPRALSRSDLARSRRIQRTVRRDAPPASRAARCPSSAADLGVVGARLPEQEVELARPAAAAADADQRWRRVSPTPARPRATPLGQRPRARGRGRLLDRAAAQISRTVAKPPATM